MYDGGPPSTVSGAVPIFEGETSKQWFLQPRISIKTFYVPGSTSSANDQPDNGPVILRTATQTSFRDLKESTLSYDCLILPVNML